MIRGNRLWAALAAAGLVFSGCSGARSSGGAEKQRITAQIRFEVSQENLYSAPIVPGPCGRVVRRDDYIRQRPQGGIGRQRLAREHVEISAAQLAAGKRPDERLLVDHLSA